MASMNVRSAFSRRLDAPLSRALALWPWSPLIVAAAYVALFLTQLRSIVQSIYVIPDIASAPYLGELYRHAPPAAHVVLGNIDWFPALWFELATHWLPAHRQVWELAPYLVSLLGVALLAWSTYRAAGRWSAMITAVVLVVASPTLVHLQFGWSVHALTYMQVALLGAFLVACVERGGTIGPWSTHVSLVALIGVVTAFGLASDKLFAVAGLAPFLLAAAVTLRTAAPQTGRSVLATAAATAVIGAVGAVVLHEIVTEDHIWAAAFPISFATYDQILPHFRLFVQSVAFLFYGDFGGLSVSFSSLLKFTCAAVVTAGIFATIVWGRSYARRLLRRPGAPCGLASGPAATHVVFWCAVICLNCLTYVFSSVPTDEYTARYLVPAAYGFATLLAVIAAASRVWRIAVVGGVSVLVVASTIALGRHELQFDPSRFPTGALAGRLAQFARSEGLKYGYAGYQDAAPLTWETKGAVELYPVIPCGTAVCAAWYHKIDSWYKPHPGRRTLFVYDPTQALSPGPPQTFGRPDRVVRINQLLVYIYPYDLAPRIAP